MRKSGSPRIFLNIHMKRLSSFLLLTVCASLMTASQAPATRSAGAALFPAREYRGPLQHAWVGASLVNPVGTVLASAAANVEIADEALLYEAHLFWMGSGATPDTSVALRQPNGSLIQVDVARETCLQVGIAADENALRYWHCTADITGFFAELEPVGGEYRLEGLSAETGGAYSSAQGFAGAFGLLLLYSNITEPTPRMIQLQHGLLYTRGPLTEAGARLPAVHVAGTGGVFSLAALEGDIELPADGACDGRLENYECDFVGLCDGDCVTPGGDLDEERLVSHFSNAQNPTGNIFNETFSSEAHTLPEVPEANFNAFDLDTFAIDTESFAGVQEQLQPFIRSGQDAVILAATVVELEEADSDGDGLSDLHESLYLGTSAENADTDGDGLSDGLEHLAYMRHGRLTPGTDPLHADTDGDGLCDGPNDVADVCTAGEDKNANGATESTETNPLQQDTDGDGLNDNVELAAPGSLELTDGGPSGSDGDSPLASGAVFFTDPTQPDSDGDGLLDGQEDINGNGRFEPGENETDPTFPDTDRGGLSDYEERLAGRDPNAGSDDTFVGDDGDEDGLTFDEENAAQSSPNEKDSDFDGLHDGIEVRGPQRTDPMNPDSDQDGIADGFEDRNQNGIRDPNESDPNEADTDSDGLPDGLEDINADGFQAAGESSATKPDTDGDGLCDGPATVSGVCTGGEDLNANGAVDPGETSPLLADTDGDGLPDGFEQLVGQYPSDTPPYERSRAYEIDSDGDGLADGLEDMNRNGRREAHETDPTQADTDGDGMSDGEEWINGRNALDPADGADVVVDAGPVLDGSVPMDVPPPVPDAGSLPADGGTGPQEDGGTDDAGTQGDAGISPDDPDGEPVPNPFTPGATFSGTTLGSCHQSPVADFTWLGLLLAVSSQIRRRVTFAFSKLTERRKR